MDPITMGIALALLGGIGIAAASKKSDDSLDQKDDVLEKLKDPTKIPVPPLDRWVEVDSEDGKFLVAPIYIAPVAIGEGKRIAELNGVQLPTPKLVDAIWKAADLKLEPNPRNHDGTFKTMNSPDMHITQLAHITKQISEKSPNWDFKLLAGTHKDIVFIPEAFGQKVNKVGIYGWHKSDGKVIQAPMWGHGLDWKDYSQGVRLVKKIG